MTFLELAQRLARESQTVSGIGQPVSVTTTTQRLADIVAWVNTAYTAIQNQHGSWRWLRSEFTGEITAGTPKYTPGSFGLTRFSRWVREDRSFSLWLTATGVSDEGRINELNSWQSWRDMYGRGPGTLIDQWKRPNTYAISPLDEFCPGPIPDASYMVRGEYFKSPQVLAADADTPEMPSRFHEMIVWKGLIMLLEADEAAPIVPQQVRLRYAEMLSALEHDELPRIGISAYSSLA